MRNDLFSTKWCKKGAVLRRSRRTKEKGKRRKDKGNEDKKGKRPEDGFASTFIL
jgi:hypothetical protein